MIDWNFQFGAVSVTGNYRENNEDRVYTDGQLGLFLVADGMGGQLAGEQASQMAVDIIPEQIRTGLPAAEQTEDKERAVAELIRRAVLEANRRILELAGRRLEFQSMGTTVVLALLRAKAAYVAGLGDSPAYLIRAGKCQQLTTDHSLAQALVDAGSISAKDLKTHRFRNILWKYLGSKEVASGPDVSIIDLAAGDWLLLASDGLTGVVPDEQIAQELGAAGDAQAVAQLLVDKALEQGSRDNVSCVTVHIV